MKRYKKSSNLRFGAKSSIMIYRKSNISFNPSLLRECDQEILRNLYGRRMDNSMAYDAIIEKRTFQTSNYPLTVSPIVHKAMQKGCIYLHGRDRKFRPFMIVKCEIFEQMKS
jgi:hypothetical protein